MDGLVIKEKLQEYIKTGDEKLLKLMYAVAKEYTQVDEYALSPEEIKELEKRTGKRLSGESEVYTWEQTKKIITGNKPFNEL